MVKNYKQLEQLSKLYLRLKDLDAEIIAIDKLAQSLSDQKYAIVMSLSMAPQDQEAAPEQPPVDGLYARLLRMEQQHPSPFSFFLTPNMPATPSNVISHLETITEATALRILAALLAEKSNERESIVEAIKGITA